MTAFDAGLLLLAMSLAVAGGARKLSTPPSVILAATGLLVGVLWHSLSFLPPLAVPPDLVLLVFLPPLLSSAAHGLSWPAFMRHLRAILVLAIALVLATMAGVAILAHTLIGLSWPLAFALGAIVAPPDPVAASSVATQVGLPNRLVVILEGEGLVNDAVAIVAYTLALRAVIGGISFGDAGISLLREAPTGVAIGATLGWAAARLRALIDDVGLEVGISLLVPYATYEIADHLRSSGVLAVVTLGFILQRREVAIASAASRVGVRTVWAVVRFVTTSLVFFLLGVLLGARVAATEIPARIALTAAAVAGAVIGLRMVWMFTIPHLLALLPGASAVPSGDQREHLVLGWSGMRGVVSLALALGVPAARAPEFAGDPRDAIVLITFGVIIVTLLIQGATLLPLIQQLGVGNPADEGRTARRTRHRACIAGGAAINRAAAASGSPASGSAASSRAAAERIERGQVGIARPPEAASADAAATLLLPALEAQRQVLTRMHDIGAIGERLMARLATELDIDEMRLRGDSAKLTGE